MATAPVKSQPLHNFSLPTYLRWGGGSSNHHHHRFRRSAPPGESPPAAEGDSDRNESDPDSRPPRAGSRHGRRFFLGGGSSSDVERKREGQRRGVKEESQRIGGKNGEGGTEGGEEAEGEPAEGEAVQRPWNLRPRRANPSPKVADLTEAVAAATTLTPSENPAPKSARLRGFADTPAAAGGEKREKRRLWMALSKEEIEEDIFVMTGSRPSRRPKKRPKHVQKQLNTAFPGLWLVGASADDFRVSDEPAKK